MDFYFYLAGEEPQHVTSVIMGVTGAGFEIVPGTFHRDNSVQRSVSFLVVKHGADPARFARHSSKIEEIVKEARGA